MQKVYVKFTMGSMATGTRCASSFTVKAAETVDFPEPGTPAIAIKTRRLLEVCRALKASTRLSKLSTERSGSVNTPFILKRVVLGLGRLVAITEE